MLRWVKYQTPDTWQILLDGWDYNEGGRRNDVLRWIFDQPNCDVATAAKFFFTAGLAGEDPESLSPWYRGDWELMKRVADNWSCGLYMRSELALDVEASDIEYFDRLAEKRKKTGQPLAFRIPGPRFRRFGTRSPRSDYFYEHGGPLSWSFDAWLKRRERGL